MSCCCVVALDWVDLTNVASGIFRFSNWVLSKASSDGDLKEFKEFFSQGNESTETKPSSFYYMELLDENPNSSDTMKHLA